MDQRLRGEEGTALGEDYETAEDFLTSEDRRVWHRRCFATLVESVVILAQGFGSKRQF